MRINMQTYELKNNIDKQNQAWAEFKNVNDDREKQIEKRGYVDALTENHLSKINGALDEFKSRIQKLELRNSRPPLVSSTKEITQDLEYKAAFSDYLRKGNEQVVSSLNRKSLSGINDKEGGYLIDNAMYQYITKNLSTNSVLRQLCSVQEISTDSFDVLSDDGNFDSGWVSEIDDRIVTSNGQISKKVIRTHEIYAQPKVTQKLIDDSKIDIAKWISERLAEKFMMAENSAFLNGDGKNKPFGILSYSSGKGSDKIEQIKSDKEGVVTAESIIRLYYSLDVRYSGKASFLMHRDMLQQIRLLKSDITGQYLWMPSIELGAPDTLLGVPVYESVDMPTPNKDAVCMMLADFKSAYMIVDRAGISLMRDPYTEKPFVKFYTTKRVGGDIIDTAAVKLLRL
jgi:HK97 family phage major capsid protein